jgi:5-dehydro-2-deoxygluconokinase
MGPAPPPSRKDRDLDVICLGRAAVDLYGEQLGVGLEDVRSFAKSLGGCAANIAVGAARQGLRAAMLTRVGDEQMGRFVRATLEAEGVDVSRVKTDPERLTGLVLLSIRGEDDFPLLFYRERCADMALAPEDFDEAFVGRARALLLTGTHFSTPGTAAASWAAIEHARRRGTRIVLDVDFRPVLWGLTGHWEGAERFVSSPRVTGALAPVLAAADVVVGTEDELRLAGGDADLGRALRATRDATSATIVLKRGRAGCVIYPGAIDRGVECPPIPVETYNVLGAGDAFMAGFLRGWLEGHPPRACGRLGNACGALVVGRHACAPAMPTRRELDAFLDSPPAGPAPLVVEEDARLARLHRTTLRPPPPGELCVLAFDHRSHFDRMVAASGAHPDAVLALELLVAEGGLRGARRARVARLGMVIDAEAGRAALASMTRRPDVWLARPIERPDYRPLAFEGGLENVDARLRTWPASHVVQCLVEYHPDGDAGLRREQKRRLGCLQQACLRLERALLLEVLPMRSARPEPDLEAVPRALERLYGAGLHPDWWKLPPQRDPAVWREIDRVITAHDPDCHGILVLGMGASTAELADRFAGARGASRRVRGFAVGRTIFGAPADAWLHCRVDDQGLVEGVATAFAEVVAAWRGESMP